MARLRLSNRNYIFSRLQSVAALLLSFGVMCLGHGLLNTVIGIRATAEGYSDLTVSLMGSAYFLGFVLCSHFCEGLLNRVGHIRTFAIFATMASGLSLLLALYVNPVMWIITRFFYGAALASLYMVMESWLNLITKNEERGQILSFYMITNYVSIALSQMLIYVAEPSSFTLFAVASIFLSFSLIPVSASRSPQPSVIKSENFSLKRLFKTSQLAVAGVFCTGAISGSFWGIGAFYLSSIGLSKAAVASFFAVMYIGSLIMQWPLGFMSDKLGRRKMIVGLSIASAIVSFVLYITPYGEDTAVYATYMACAFLFGGVNNTLHSLFLALANDFLKPEQVVKASGGLISVHGAGAIFGPIAATAVIYFAGRQGLMLFCAMVAMTLVLIATYRVFTGRKIPKATRDVFVPMFRAGRGITKLDPRQDEPTE